jgi:hypothetical protein
MRCAKGDNSLLCTEVLDLWGRRYGRQTCNAAPCAMAALGCCAFKQRKSHKECTSTASQAEEAWRVSLLIGLSLSVVL